MINDNPERARLARLSAAKNDEELQKLADDAVSLTEAGHECLVQEAQRRGLELRWPLPVQSADAVERRELVTIRQFRDLPEAVLAKGMLDSAGIECFLGDENMVRLGWFMNLLGGIKLVVNQADALAAEEILSQPIPENFEVEGIGGYQQPCCPNCQSVDISFKPLNKPIAYTSAWVGLPLPLPQNSWKCNRVARDGKILARLIRKFLEDHPDPYSSITAGSSATLGRMCVQGSIFKRSAL